VHNVIYSQVAVALQTVLRTERRTLQLQCLAFV